MNRKKIKVVLSLAVCVLFITTSFSISAGEVFYGVNNKTSNIHLAMVPPGYPNLSEIIAEMNNASAAYPSICKMVDLTTTYDAPSTYEDRHLYAVKISDNVNEDEDEPTFLMVSCHHCREIVTPVIALYAIEQFTTKYGSDPQITALVDEYEIWITPVWNPDGYEYVFYHDNMWRKNRRYFPEHNSYGVDLNRNYPFGWYSGCSGSTNPFSETYKGPSPASEAETQTMIVFSNDQHFAKVLDYHSSGREVLWGYCCHNHPFDTFFQSEAIRLSTAAGYGGSNRPPSAEGENYEWQLATNGTYANLMETHTSFQPSYSSAQSEAAKVWPGTLWMLERPISLSGHVKDYYNGQPLAANISLCGITFPNGEEFKSEPSFGRYHLFLPPDSYTIEFSAPGYINQSHQITITLDSAEVHDVLLKQINGPPEIPCKPSGQTNGTSGHQYLYTTNTTDPDGDKVFYNFSWGDGNYSDWIGPYNSGETASARYTWTEKGTYEIKVKARDILGRESNWSEPLEVSMPKNQAHIHSLLLRNIFFHLIGISYKK